MTRSDHQQSDLHFRPLSPRYVDALEQWNGNGIVITDPSCDRLNQTSGRFRHHSISAWWQRVNALARPHRSHWTGFVATLGDDTCGLIEISPFNRTRSTWRVDCVAVNADVVPAGNSGPLDRVGSPLLRHCFAAVWEARMWLAEVDIEQKSALALYRQNGFQPLAQVTYWEITPELLAELGKREPDLPNLMAVSNADAQLLYQLDTASMPPLVRQVFDQQIQDFKVEPLQSMAATVGQWMKRVDRICSYVFEPQRKAAIGRFELTACRDAHKCHFAELTVHPAYTWLYPEIISHLARVLEAYPSAPLRITSRDYQAEREDYLTQIQASPVDRTLMLSRSVWHKVREAKPAALEGLQLPEVLAGLQPVGKPIPGRLSWQSQSDESGRKRSQSDSSTTAPGKETNSADKPSHPPNRNALPGESW
ncbi:MAG: GNAT family N-acetyltransferase [Cyanobacteria bacterium J06626_18]